MNRAQRRAAMKVKPRVIAHNTSTAIPVWPEPSGTVPAATRPLIQDIGIGALSRESEHWTAGEGDSVTCNLCYRGCELAEGETGWCRIRSNNDGKIALAANGVLSISMRVETPQHFAFKMFAPVQFFAGVSCTSACSFCDAGALALDPARLPLAEVGVSTLYKQRGAMSPAEAIEAAAANGVRAIHLGGNEPLLTYEWTLDTARLAKARGWDVILDSNGFSPPEVIREIAPYIDHIRVGVKGSASPDFYDKHMRSPGAVPHVLAGIEEWHRTPDTVLTVIDVLAPPHWMSNRQAGEAMHRFYGWLARAVSPLMPVEVRTMWMPEKRPYTALSNGTGSTLERLETAMQIARAAGLRYAINSTDGSMELPDVPCHHCGQNLLPDHARDHACARCGAWVPIVT